MKKIIFFILLLLFSNIVFARGMQIITDAETENVIKEFITPLIRAANLNVSNIEIRIVNDPEINAFVTNGTNVFINTGLIIKFKEDPNVLYGVMAHEIAHIYAGHLIAKRGEYENMSTMAIGGTILGLASILAGAPEAGALIASAATTGAVQNMLKYSRIHETEADKIAVELLYKTHNNGQGLIKLFKYLSSTERMYDINPYAITHPLSYERIASVENAIKSKLSGFGNNITPKTKFEFIRIANKLEAFLTSPSSVIKKFRNNNYAESIGYFRIGKLSKASSLLDKVIAEEPNDPYLWELKGQYYYENGIFNEAERYYEKALRYLPNDKIFKVELASVKINMAKGAQDKVLLNSAISLLKQVTAQRNDLIAYYMLSLAYGKLGDKTRAILALAEYYFYQGETERSQKLANKVLKMTPKSSREYLRASDIIEFIKTNQRKK
jgi:predicted Zn-dependent protease